MHFHERLLSYLNETKSTQKNLATATGLSAATISRYCSGDREPEYDSRQTKLLAKGIADLSVESQTPLSEETVLKELNKTLRQDLIIDYDHFLNKLNTLLGELDIRGSELARALNYDPSHISKILSGARRPGNVHQFAENTADYIAARFANSNEAPTLAAILDVQEEDIRTVPDMRDRLVSWFSSGPAPRREEPMSRFLEKLDDFDLNEYMNAIHFDDLKVPTAPFHLPTGKTYYGLRDMMESELDFMKTTVLSKSMDDCILYSDMPLEEMASDPEFPKKWMLGMGMMLKKGLHLHIIHDVNRPFDEMMLGLESNIPMYMTGQISPYYLPATQSSVFLHLLKVSGSAALEGSAIAGKQKSGKYVLYRSKTDVQHYRQRAKDLLRKAQPLMKIYTVKQKDSFFAYLRKLTDDNCRTVAGNLPIFTMSDALLEQILERTTLSSRQKSEIREYLERSRQKIFALLDNNKTIELVLPELSEEQFAESKMCLALAGIFIEDSIPYTYEEYLAHLADTRKLAEACPNLRLEMNPVQVFRNITFSILGDRLVIVSKEKSPAIHFVIHHKKMVQAFKNFIPPIIEE